MLFHNYTRLHTHLHADAVLVAVLLKQIFSAVINADMPAPPAVRCRLVGCVTVIDVIVCGNVLEIPVMLTKREEIKLQRTGYTVSYNNFYKTPNWVPGN